MKKKERRPKCLTVLKTDVAVGKVSPEGAAAVPTPGDAQRVGQAVDRAVVRAKAQAEKDSQFGGYKAYKRQKRPPFVVKSTKKGPGI